MITRWQAARGYPKSGYLNKLQHKALLTEIVATTPTAAPATTRKKPARAAPAAAAAAVAAVGSVSAAAAAVPIPPAPAASSAA